MGRNGPISLFRSKFTRRNAAILTLVNILLLVYSLHYLGTLQLLCTKKGRFGPYIDSYAPESEFIKLNAQCLDFRRKADDLPVFVDLHIETAAKNAKRASQIQEQIIENGVIDGSNFAETKNPDARDPVLDPKIDVIITWVDDSDQFFQQQKSRWEKYADFDNAVEYTKENVNRFRSWDELRYCVRAVFKFLHNFNSIWLITASSKNGYRSPQRPSWLQENRILEKNKFFLISQDQIALSDKCSPFFSSPAAEACIPRLPEWDGQSDIMLSFSDDMLIGKEIPATDIWNAYTGLSLWFDYHTLENPFFNQVAKPNFGRKEGLMGEWPFLFHTSWIMNERFGRRGRPYTAHIMHPLYRYVLNEVVETFPRTNHLSLSHRWRGETPAFHLWTAHNWYLIERHREALLYSLIGLKADVDQDGKLSIAEKENAFRHYIKKLESSNEDIKLNRKSLSDLQSIASNLTLPEMKSVKPYWTSMDGPLWFLPGLYEKQFKNWKENQILTIRKNPEKVSNCLKMSEEESTRAIFERLSKNDPECGDFIIKLGLLDSGERGLSGFLPEDTTEEQPGDYNRRKRGNLTRKQTAISIINRYSYSVSDLDYYYYHVREADGTNEQFTKMLNERKYAICLNDQMDSKKSDQSEKVNRLFAVFFENYYGPEKSPVEK